jgi:hypothetical protein
MYIVFMSIGYLAICSVVTATDSSGIFSVVTCMAIDSLLSIYSMVMALGKDDQKVHVPGVGPVRSD